MAELLPCPFCGSKVHMTDLDDEDERRVWVRYIECETCDLKMRDWTGWPPKGVPFDREKMSGTVAASLSAMWNRRASKVIGYAVLDMSGESFHSIHETEDEASQSARFLGSVVKVTCT